MQPTVFTPEQIQTQARILSRITRKPVREGFTECWEWDKLDSHGYGSNKEYRRSYEAFVGPIPAGLHIDHLCVNRPCVNPEHLEPVTFQENIRRAVAWHQARGTGHWNKIDICRKGLHEMSGWNVMTQKVKGRTVRLCRQCAAERQKAFLAANPDKVAKYYATKRAKYAAKKARERAAE